MITPGGKYEVTTYVPKEMFDFLTEERGPASMAKYVRELLRSYMVAVRNGEIPEDPNVN